MRVHVVDLALWGEISFCGQSDSFFPTLSVREMFCPNESSENPNKKLIWKI